MSSHQPKKRKTDEELRQEYLEYLRRIVEGDAWNDIESLNRIQPFNIWKQLRF